MAESPQGLHDSRFSGSGPHTTTRGASAPAVLGDLAAAERHLDCVFVNASPVASGALGTAPLHENGGPMLRNGLAFGLRGHVQPC